MDVLRRISEAEVRIQQLAEEVLSRGVAQSEGNEGSSAACHPFTEGREQVDGKAEAAYGCSRESSDTKPPREKPASSSTFRPASGLLAADSVFGQRTFSTIVGTPLSPSDAESPYELEALNRRIHGLESKMESLKADVKHLNALMTHSQSLSGYSSKPFRPSFSDCLLPLPPPQKSSFGSGNDVTPAGLSCTECINLIHMAFDLDGNGYLGYTDCAKLQEITAGTSLSVSQYLAECKRLNVNPDTGLDVCDLQVLYDD
eukprot:gene1200-1860_t